VPEARSKWNSVAAITSSPDAKRFALNETYSCASAGKNETQCAAVRNTVGAMRLPLQRASSPVMMPFPSKSKSSAPTFAKLLSPVGRPLMMKEGRSGGAVGEGASRHVAVAEMMTSRASVSSARFSLDPFMASSFVLQLLSG